MAKKLSGFLMTILSPVIKELPFFVFTALMLIEQPIRNIHEQIVNPSFRTSVENLAGQVAIVFLFSYLLTALVAWARKKWLKISLYAIIGFLFAASQFLWHNFLMTINPQALVLVAETNKREASGFFDQFLFSRASLTSYAIIAAVIIAIVLAERWYHRRQHVKPKATAGKTILASLLTLVLIGGIVASKCYFRIFSYQTNDQLQNQELIHAVYPSDPISLLGQSIYGLHLCSNETKQALETNRQISKTNSTIAGTDSLNVVLVIGESYNKWHAGIYGYSLNTTPNMMREREAGNLTVFDDAVTSFGLTSPSMKNMLCCNNFSEGETWSQYPFFPAIFKSAGYHVYMWDNQKELMPFANFSFSINSFIYHPEIIDMSYTQMSDMHHIYDYPVVNSFKNEAKDLSAHNLVIFHLMGQHSPPYYRYPHVEQFDHFTADSIQRQEPYLTAEKKKLIAEYDNSTLFNDHVLNNIFDQFRNKNAVVVYLSDHGEETYDYKDATWRVYKGIEKGWLKNIHNIPFVIWCSDEYIEKHPETVEAIRSASQRPFTIDNICHLMFHLGELNTPYYKAERDVISDRFKPGKRLVEGKDDLVKADYDKVMNGK